MITSAPHHTTRRSARGSVVYACFAVLAAQVPITAIGQSVYATPYTFTTLAGMPGLRGTNDGAGSAARFYGPDGAAVDCNGNVYVADYGNNTIRKVTPDGVVTTIAGQPQFNQSGLPVGGTNDGVGSEAQFSGPSGVAVDSNGILYVADERNSTIRKVAPMGTNWLVTTIAGQPGISGLSDGTNSDALFNGPASVAVDIKGNLFVPDANHAIREVTPVGSNWVVTSVPPLHQSGIGIGGPELVTVPFYSTALAVDTNDNIYVADYAYQTIEEVTPVGTNWVVTTLAGQLSTPGTNDGIGGAAQFVYPRGLAVDANTNLYVAEQNWPYGREIRKVTPVGTNWVVTTLAGVAAPYGGTNDGTGSGALFVFPTSVAVDANGNLYVADGGSYTIRKGYPPGSVPQPILQPPNLSAGQFGFGIAGLPNLAVDVQSSADLSNWQTLGSNYIVLVGGTNFFTDSSPAQGSEFYRVRVR